MGLHETPKMAPNTLVAKREKKRKRKKGLYHLNLMFLLGSRRFLMKAGGGQFSLIMKGSWIRNLTWITNIQSGFYWDLVQSDK